MVTLKLSSIVVDDSKDGNTFLRKLLLTNTQVLRLCKAFVNGTSATIKFSKTQWHKIGKSRRFWVRLVGLLLKTGLTSIGNVHFNH